MRGSTVLTLTVLFGPVLPLPVSLEVATSPPPVVDVTELAQIIDQEFQEFEPFSLLSAGDARFDLVQVPGQVKAKHRDKSLGDEPYLPSSDPESQLGKHSEDSQRRQRQEDSQQQKLRDSLQLEFDRVLGQMARDLRMLSDDTDDEDPESSPEESDTGTNDFSDFEGRINAVYEPDADYDHIDDIIIEDPEEEPGEDRPTPVDEIYEIDPAHSFFVVPFAGEHHFRTNLRERITTSRLDEQKKRGVSTPALEQLHQETLEKIQGLSSLMAETRSQDEDDDDNQVVTYEAPGLATGPRRRNDTMQSSYPARGRETSGNASGNSSRIAGGPPSDQQPPGPTATDDDPSALAEGSADSRTALKVPRYLQTRQGMRTMRHSLDSIIEEIRFYFEKVGLLFGQAEDTILDVDDMLTNFAGQNSNLYQRYESDPQPERWARGGSATL